MSEATLQDLLTFARAARPSAEVSCTCSPAGPPCLVCRIDTILAAIEQPSPHCPSCGLTMHVFAGERYCPDCEHCETPTF